MRERRPGVWELRAYGGRDPNTNVPKQVSRTVHGGERVAQTQLAALVTEAKAGKMGRTDALVSVPTSWPTPRPPIPEQPPSLSPTLSRSAACASS